MCSGGAIVESLEIGSYTGYGPQEEDGVKVHVLEPFWMRGNAVNETPEVGVLCSC